MSVFEDLIDELKEENLLEATVVDAAKPVSVAKTENDKTPLDSENSKNINPENENDSIFQETGATGSANFSAAVQNENTADSKKETTSGNREKGENFPEPLLPEAVNSVDQTEFFRKRATDEVLSLQMVERVFSGIMRLNEKPAPQAYDDLKVKKNLHDFLQVSDKPDSSKHAEAEFLLKQETENWYAALSHIDRQISVTNLRHYCETVKPVLSSQALISLSRFYRNSAYSEAVRAKFDLITTRLFTRDLPNKKREIVSEKNGLVQQLSELYDEWESISLYTSEEDESEVLITALKFKDFISEAEHAGSFDELIRNDFFNRLGSFKQSTTEQFFTPLITETAIESNVKIGNKYIELLEQEKENGNIEKLENTYGFLHDQVISDAVSKSLKMVDILKTKFAIPAAVEPKVEESEKKLKVNKPPQKEKQKTLPAPVIEDAKKGISKVLIAAIAVVLIFAGWFAWSGKNSGANEKISQDVKKVSLESSALNEYIKDARIGNDTFFGIVLPNWENLSQDEKQGILKKILSVSQEKGFKDVRLLNSAGKTVASVSGGVIDLRK